MGAPEENQIKDMQEERKFYEEMTPAERAAIFKEKTGVILLLLLSYSPPSSPTDLVPVNHNFK